MRNPQVHPDRCLTSKNDTPSGSFDARTVAHQVIVPFDQANESVLGGAPEPYVNNPVRVPEVSARYRAPQKNKEDWDKLCELLNLVQQRNSKKFSELGRFLRRFIEGLRRSMRGERDQINKLIDSEFVSGQNIYVTDLISLARAILALLGE
jgi:hypothetical protein